MTNEEAIELLKEKRMEINYQVNGTTQFSKALDMAIKALEQQPSKDAISREELRNLICQHNDKYGYSDRFHEFTERCLQLPSVTSKFTDDEIQKMQELEQAQLEKAYELGKIEMQPCNDCISREDALKAIEEQKKGFYGVERYAIDECHSAVMKLPSVRPYKEIVEDKRACEKCIHYVTRDSRGVVLCGCDSWECDFEEVKT